MIAVQELVGHRMRRIVDDDLQIWMRIEGEDVGAGGVRST